VCQPVVSDGQRSIRNAVATVAEAVHGLCHFHYFHEAAKPLMKQTVMPKELKKRVRGCVIERSSTTHEELLLWLQAIVRQCASPNQDGCPPRNARIEVA